MDHLKDTFDYLKLASASLLLHIHVMPPSDLKQELTEVRAALDDIYCGLLDAVDFANGEPYLPEYFQNEIEL